MFDGNGIKGVAGIGQGGCSENKIIVAIRPNDYYASAAV